MTDKTNLTTPIELINQAIEDVSVILTRDYPEHLNFGDGSFTISHGSTQVMIIIRPFTKDDACIECISNVVTGAKITEELMKFMLRTNSELHFGGFGLMFDDTITYSHSFSASCLKNKELQITLDSIAAIADYYDDIIIASAGGKTAIESNNETIYD